MIARRIAIWRLVVKPRDAVPGRWTDVAAAPESTTREYEEQYLLSLAEAMLRAGHGHKDIERALRRMSPGPGPSAP